MNRAKKEKEGTREREREREKERDCTESVRIDIMTREEKY